MRLFLPAGEGGIRFLHREAKLDPKWRKNTSPNVPHQDRKDAEKIKLAEANKKKIQKEAKQKRAAEQSAPKRPVYKYQSTMDSADLIINVVDARDVLVRRRKIGQIYLYRRKFKGELFYGASELFLTPLKTKV